MKLPSWLTGWFAALLILLCLVAAAAPLEYSLGANIRLVYLHGAWVWAALTCFAVSAAAGLAGILMSSLRLHRWSRAIGLAGMAAWLTYLPMSLLVMQINWGGLYFDEPRWRIPFMFAVTAVLLQAGLWLLSKPVITSAANFLFGCALFWSLAGVQTILHPESPVFTSSSITIRVYFGGLLLLAVITAGLLAANFYRMDRNQFETKPL